MEGIKEKDQNPSGAFAPTEALTKNDPPITTEKLLDAEFESAWTIYPKRHGGNPKNDALKSWNARRKEGIAPADMMEGVKRYHAHLKSEGKIGTEYVMQAVRFFGPNKLFSEEWPTKPSRTGYVHDLSTMNYEIGVDEDGRF